MPISPEAWTEAENLAARFREAGALDVTADILLPAETLLDLYGENIRHRAYVTWDPTRGEMMLRPDFTVPVVLEHLASGRSKARYTYSGEVFRRQIEDTGQPSEYLQVGFEVFDGDTPIEADAEVFATFSQVLAPFGLRAVIGDIGIITAAIDGLETTERRKAALNRHLWRPARFRRLLDRFAGRAPAPAGRAELLEITNPAQVLEKDAVFTGLRSEAEVLERIEGLRNEAAVGPIATQDVAVLDEILNLNGNAPAALDRLNQIAEGRPALTTAVERMGERLAAIENHGVDIEALGFEASYGRGSLEYYDGFVFGFTNGGATDQPPVASGGRYDALTQVLGQGKATPAVGGIVRPGMIADLRMGEADA